MAQLKAQSEQQVAQLEESRQAALTQASALMQDELAQAMKDMEEKAKELSEAQKQLDDLQSTVMARSDELVIAREEHAKAAELNAKLESELRAMRESAGGAEKASLEQLEAANVEVEQLKAQLEKKNELLKKEVSSWMSWK